MMNCYLNINYLLIIKLINKLTNNNWWTNLLAFKDFLGRRVIFLKLQLKTCFETRILLLTETSCFDKAEVGLVEI